MAGLGPLWNERGRRSPALTASGTISDRLRAALASSMLDNFWALMEEGADINTLFSQDKTPLHLVIEWKKDFNIVSAVLSAGANPNAIDFYGNAPLHTATYSNSSPAIIKALIDAGAEIDMPDLDGRSPLMKSIYQMDNYLIIRALVYAGANVKVKNLLVEAVQLKCELEVIRLLIVAGASVNDTSTGISPISHAVMNGDIRVVRLLLAAGARIDYRHPENGTTLLHQAKNVNIVQKLIKKGMHVDIVDNLGETPLHTAVKHDLLDIVTTLMNAGANPHRLRRSGDNCFHFARSVPMVRMLASLGVDINARNRLGSTPLLVLVGYCNLLSTPFFEREGGYLPGRLGTESYEQKKTKGKLAIKEMIECGADVNMTDYNDVCVLELAVNLNSPDIVMYLIKQGIEVHWDRLFALERTDRNSMKLLIRESVFGNVRGEDLFDYPVEDPLPRRWTPLYFYAHRCRAEIELMRVTNINCKSTIYHYVLEIAPTIKALRLCSHYQFNDEECMTMFPIYKYKISERLNDCYRRAAMLDILENVDIRARIGDENRFVSLIIDCKIALARFLSNLDLMSLLLAMGLNFPSDPLPPKRMNCGEITPPIDE